MQDELDFLLAAHDRVIAEQEGSQTQDSILAIRDLSQRLRDRYSSADERKLMARLRKMDRETLEAFYVRGQSLAEMAKAFDAPIGTIKRRLHVARKRLAEEVSELATV